MLSHIRITNLAIIDELDVELSPGLTVLTGETGAGKSIMLDAIGLVLGDRADAGRVRHGAERADISLTIETNRADILAWLEQNDLAPEDGICLLRRVITAEGRSRSYINGSPTTLAMMRDLAERLVDIHGQNAHLSLRSSAAQRALLDDFGQLQDDVEAVRQRYHEWQTAQTELDDLREGDAERQSRIDLLRFQVGELQDLALREGEVEQLDEALSRLAHADQLKTTVSQALEALYEQENSLYQGIATYQSALIDAGRYDERLTEPGELLQGALIQIEEAVARLRELDAVIEADPARLADVEQRLGLIHDLARKHRIEPEALAEKTRQMEDELARLTGPESNLPALERKVRELAERYDQQALHLRGRRIAAAKSLSRQITESMQTLGMEGGVFEVEITPLEPGIRRASGAESIEFQVSANPGQPLRPLTRVASGGELSRISLAIQLAASAQTRVATMIFDEVDSGVGGAVAETVGQKLRQLGEHTQVFCVTHLPQVAACGHHHLRVHKTKTRNTTQTTLTRLEDQDRIEEIARMLGGKTLTEQTRKHAAEMLQQNSG